MQMIRRAVDWSMESNCTLRVCSAEDLIIQKAFAGRPQDWVDVQTIVTRQGQTLNQDTIRTELKILLELKPSSDALEQLERLFKSID